MCILRTYIIIQMHCAIIAPRVCTYHWLRINYIHCAHIVYIWNVLRTQNQYSMYTYHWLRINCIYCAHIVCIWNVQRTENSYSMYLLFTAHKLYTLRTFDIQLKCTAHSKSPILCTYHWLRIKCTNCAHIVFIWNVLRTQNPYSMYLPLTAHKLCTLRTYDIQLKCTGYSKPI